MIEKLFTGTLRINQPTLMLVDICMKFHDANYDGLESPMLHTKFRENRPSGSGEEDF